MLDTLATIPVGDAPRGVAINPSRQLAYIANAGSNTISILERAGVVATVVVGQEPRGVAIDPALHRVYVANARGQSLSVLDDAINRVIATITLGFDPTALAVAPDIHQIFVGGTTTLSGNEFGRIAILDGTADRVVSVLPLGGSQERSALQLVNSLAVDSALHTVYVAFSGKDGGNLLLLDEMTHRQVVATLRYGHAAAVAVDPITHRLAVAPVLAVPVLVDRADDGLRTTAELVQLGHDPLAATIDAQSAIVYVTTAPGGSTANGTLTAVDERDGRVLGTAPVGKQPSAVAVDPLTHRVYIANEGDATITIICGINRLVATATSGRMVVATP